MKKIIAMFGLFAVVISFFASFNSALAYGGGGGTVISSCQPSFYDITPVKDANLSSLNNVEFSIKGSQLSSESNFLSVTIEDQLITDLNVTEKANGDLRVTADVSSYISNGVNKITLWARTKRSASCQRTLAYFINITPGEDIDSDDTTSDDDGTGGGDSAGVLSLGFNDTTGHWASYYIEQLQALGIVSGDGNTGNFRPDSLINRSEATKMILKALGISIPASVYNPPFPDVPVSAWFAVFVSRAKELGIVNGYKDGTFKPGNSITRAEMLKIILLAAGLNVSSSNANVFTDVPSSSWYYHYVAYAYNNGIILGYIDGTYRPNEPITRAETVKIIIKLFYHLGWT